jgi:hypothetical protein
MYGSARIYRPRLTEIAILVTARYWTAQFEWQAHARLARQASLGPGGDRCHCRAANADIPQAVLRS